MLTRHDVTAVILAGGKGSRMDGRDKGLVTLANRPLIEYVIEAVKPQAEHVMINANRNLEQYAVFGYPVVTDTLSGFQGPLAGYLSALTASTTRYIATVPCDGPFLPDDLVDRLIKALTASDAEIAVAHDGQRLQPVYSLIPTALANSLSAFLETGERKIDIWYAQHRVALADFADCPETFINVNTAEQRDRLQNEGLVS